MSVNEGGGWISTICFYIMTLSSCVNFDMDKDGFGEIRVWIGVCGIVMWIFNLGLARWFIKSSTHIS